MTDQVPVSRRLVHRRMTPADLDAVSGLLGDPRVMAHYPRPWTRQEAAAWIARNQAGYARDGWGLWLLHDHEGGFVGECGLTWQVFDGVEDLEIGYHLRPEHQGRGLATEAALACRELARAHGVRRLTAIVRAGNLASERVAEKLGLTVERESTDEHGTVRLYAAPL